MSRTQTYKTQFMFNVTGSDLTNVSGYTPFAQVLDIKPPKVETKDVETTTIDAPDGFETFDPSQFANGGEATLRIQFDKTQQVTVFGLFRQPKCFAIQFNDGTNDPSSPSTGSILGFAGYIKSIEHELVKKELVEVTVVMKVSGAPKFTPGT